MDAQQILVVLAAMIAAALSGSFFAEYRRRSEQHRERSQVRRLTRHP